MKQIANYTVEEQPLGSGGMGRVLKGYAPDGTPVAIKEILPEFVTDMEFRVRIDREINFLARLNNSNVVKIYNNFQIGSNMYIVMELVEGQNIEQRISTGGAMPMDMAVRFMLKILDTMQYVHEQGIVHRDIKPSNIMIRPNDEICLLDFGIAKDVNSVGGTLVGTVIGTDGYMSPEQADGMTIDHRSDIYSLACVFFYMLTGHHAYTKTGNDMAAQLDMVDDILKKPFPRISKYVKNIPSGIQEVMDHATDKNMLVRYQSCREFRNELLKISGGTQIRTGNRTETPTITVGREGCDICVEPNNYKVSRHHADIKIKEFTGGTFYVYTDCSSNGTLIDGQMYTKGMSCNIPTGRMPAIYLAADPSCPLDWAEVTRLMNERIAAMRAEDKPDASGRTINMTEEDVRKVIGDIREDGGKGATGWLQSPLLFIVLGFILAIISVFVCR